MSDDDKIDDKDDKVAWRPQPDPLVEELIEQARGKNVEQRNTALKALFQMGPAGIETLLQLLYTDTRKRHNLKTIITVLAWVMIPVSMLMLPVILFSLCTNTLMQTTLFAAGVWLLNWFLFVMRTRLPLSARQKAIMPIISEINDMRAIGPLVDILNSKSIYNSDLLQAPLTRLLLQVRSSDAHLLDRANRAILCRQLDTMGSSRNQESIAFTVAILRALEQVGDAEAVPYVGQLAHRLPPPAPEVREAAKRCLEFLQLRGGAQNIRQTYLRAADKTVARPDQLLRAAQNSGESQPDQLLRPEATGQMKAIGEEADEIARIESKKIAGKEEEEDKQDKEKHQE